jgi:hypothetical protein
MGCKNFCKYANLRFQLTLLPLEIPRYGDFSMIYPWSLNYVNAVLESDPAKLRDRILEAEQAMLRRARATKLGINELEAMQSAVQDLQNVRQSRAAHSQSIFVGSLVHTKQ